MIAKDEEETIIGVCREKEEGKRRRGKGRRMKQSVCEFIRGES